VKERNDYDYLNQAYLARKDQNEKIARALIVYSGCPAVAAKKPGLTDKHEIHNFVRQLLPETILEIIAQILPPPAPRKPEELEAEAVRGRAGPAPVRPGVPRAVHGQGMGPDPAPVAGAECG
jgi:hypothetical protein